VKGGFSPSLPSSTSMRARQTYGELGICLTGPSATLSASLACRHPRRLRVLTTLLRCRTKSSASLWTLYIDFEIRNGELARAKALIYRSVRECPWCRGTSSVFILLAGRPLIVPFLPPQSSTSVLSLLLCARSIVRANLGIGIRCFLRRVSGVRIPPSFRPRTTRLGS
jgi:hypothetical protein